MPKAKYIIQTGPKKRGTQALVKNFFRKRQFVFSVIGAYVLIGGLLGYMLFNTNNDLAQASESAGISVSLRLIEEREIGLGDSVSFAVTMQNTSPTEPINDINIELLSTKDAITFNTLSGGNIQTDVVNRPIQKGTFKLPVLSAGERAQYTIKGEVQNNQVEFVTVLGKVTFVNKEAAQEVNTNRVFTQLKDAQVANKTLTTLSTQKTSFFKGEQVTFSIKKNTSIDENEGKLYISKENSDFITSSACTLSDEGECFITEENLSAGSYSAIFLDENGKITSEIARFSVAGSSGEFIPDVEANVSFPFGFSSINGLVPVTAEYVVDFNQQVNSEYLCTFNVKQGDQVVRSYQAPISRERSCKTVIDAAQITTPDGLYTVELANSDKQREVTIVDKQVTPFVFNTVGSYSLGQDISLVAQDVFDIEGNSTDGVAGSLLLWNKTSDTFEKVSILNGQSITITNGQWTGNLPSSYLSEAGVYAVALELESGEVSDFVTVDLSDQSFGIPSSGILFGEYDNLRVGNAMQFTLGGLTSRSGQSIESGSCIARLYLANQQVIEKTGQVISGVCTATFESGAVSKSGPALITFASQQDPNTVIQSRHVVISEGAPAQFGNLGFEYEPVIKNYANKIIVGPILDIANNPITSADFSVSFANSEGEIMVKNIIVEDGLATVPVASSKLNYDTLSVNLIYQGDVVKTRDLTTTLDDEKTVLPEFETSYSSTEDISISYTASSLDGIDCSLSMRYSDAITVESVSSVVSESSSCTFAENSTQYRDRMYTFWTLIYGDREFNFVTENQSSDAANSFTVAPQVRLDGSGEVYISVLSSPLLDQNGLLVDSAEYSVEYNGKVKKGIAKHGLFTSEFLAADFDKKDIRSVLQYDFLELSINSTVGITSASQTKNISVFLGDMVISNTKPTFSIRSGQTRLVAGEAQVFTFTSDTCSVASVNDRQEARSLKTHEMGGICYVQVDGNKGNYSLQFDTNGFTTGSFNVEIGDQQHNVAWCETAKCIIQASGSIARNVSATIFEDENEFTFNAEDGETVVEVSQNGLNPLKEYLVKVMYFDGDDREVQFYNTLEGEVLS